MEDKRVCPHCGHKLYKQPYLMSVDPDAEPPRWAQSAARWVVLFLVVFAVFALLSHASLG
jgi:hypothetical protein